MTLSTWLPSYSSSFSSCIFCSCAWDTDPLNQWSFSTHTLSYFLSLGMLFSLSRILSHVRNSVKLFLMPEAEPIILFPLLKQSWTPYYYGMYHPELQLTLYRSFPPSVLGIPWRKDRICFCSLPTPLHLVQTGTQQELNKNISWRKWINKWK